MLPRELRPISWHTLASPSITSYSPIPVVTVSFVLPLADQLLYSPRLLAHQCPLPANHETCTSLFRLLPRHQLQRLWWMESLAGFEKSCTLTQPVSLDSTHLHSAPFEINLAGNYTVSLQLDFSVDDQYEDKRCNYKAVGKPRWRLFRLDSANTPARALTASSEQADRDTTTLQTRATTVRCAFIRQLDIPSQPLVPGKRVTGQ